MADPLRPRSLEDLFIAQLQDQSDDAGDTDTQLYDAQFVTEQAALSDAITLSTHSATYTYNSTPASPYGAALYS